VKSTRIWIALALTCLAGCGGASVPLDVPYFGDEDSMAAGLEIVAAVNAYRVSLGLPAIPASPALGVVADAHVHDLHDHEPHEAPGCNLHSWSDQGSWVACCYTGLPAQYACMWNKPQELTNYPGIGYENAASGVTSPTDALNRWRGSAAHHDVIVNQGPWANVTWRAVGAALYRGYAVLWFGEEVDPGSQP
jgi:hypothetical protein